MPVNPEILQILLRQRQNGKNKYETHAHRAALVRGHNIIIGADNHYVSKRLSFHAEAAVLDKLVRGGNKKYNLYVVRTGKGDWGGNSRPCLHCLQHMADTNCVNHVIFSDGKDYTVSTVNKLLSEDNQHISAGHRHYCCLDEDEDDEDNKPNL